MKMYFLRYNLIPVLPSRSVFPDQGRWWFPERFAGLMCNGIHDPRNDDIETSPVDSGGRGQQRPAPSAARSYPATLARLCFLAEPRLEKARHLSHIAKAAGNGIFHAAHIRLGKQRMGPVQADVSGFLICRYIA
ncbi:hypothetical protein [Puniceibacterium confluentis]|uniref:hypothetical protein n=1 Tax=Puniceibacterium confluentis TaxID=1958944 RepID=UPI0035625DA6